MAINFTDSPSDGDTITANGKTYTYESSSAKWKASAADSGGGGGGVTTYANIAALPSSGNTGGDLAFVTDVKAFYGWDGTEWDRVFSGKNMLPEFTTSPAASYDLAADGTATTVTVAATDPEGFAVSYSHDTSPTNQAQATITQSGGTFTVTPSTSSSNAGTFTARFKAFDGVRTNSASSTFKLSFYPGGISPYGWWDFGESSSYGGSGTTWSDISTNSNDMTFSGGTYTSSSSTHSVPTMQFDNSGGNFIFPSDVRSNAKTYVMIFYQPTNANFMLMGDGTTSRYHFYFVNGNAGLFNAPGFSAWTGETILHYVNGSTPPTSKDVAADALDYTKYNMAAVTGLDVTSHSYRWMGYSGLQRAAHVRAVLAYDSILTTTQLASISSYYSDELGSSNMTAWSS